MLAWMGGRRRLVKEQRARRKLQGVFDKVATKFKPAGVTTGKQARPAREVDAVAERLGRLGPLSGEGSASLSLDVAAILGPAPMRLMARPLQEEEEGHASPAAGSGARAQPQHLGSGAEAEGEDSWHTPRPVKPTPKPTHESTMEE